MSDKAVDIYIRPEFEAGTLGEAANVDVERQLSLFERIRNINAVRKLRCWTSGRAIIKLMILIRQAQGHRVFGVRRLRKSGCRRYVPS